MLEQRIWAPWQPWEAIPVALAAMLAWAVASLPIAAFLGLGGIAILLATFVLQACLAGFTALWVRLRYPASIEALGLRSHRAPSDLVLGALVGLAIFVVSTFGVFQGIQVVIRAVTGRPASFNQLPFELTPGLIAVAAVMVVFVAPVAEEIFFRGFLFGSLRSRHGFLVAAAVSSAIFGLFHGTAGWVLIPVLFVVGFGLALVYEWRRSLVASMAAHAAFNIVGFALLVMTRT